jgi:transcriptional regulator with XRE-family HTH domain
MTPFGSAVRQLRNKHKITLKQLAAALNLQSSYLSSLELGRKGKPNPRVVAAVIRYFELNEKKAAELKSLANLSDPKIHISTESSPSDYKLIHLLANNLNDLNDWQREIIYFAISHCNQKDGFCSDQKTNQQYQFSGN